MKTFSYAMPDHVIERLRERVGDAAPGYHHLDDDALREKLDEWTRSAVRREAVEDIIDSEGEPATLVNLSDVDSCPATLYALVKPNKSRGKEAEAIITVMTPSMVARCRSQSWGTRINSPFARLGELVTPVEKPATPTAVEKPATPTPEQARYRVTFLDVADVEHTHEFISSPSEAANVVTRFIEDGRSEVRLWREVPFRVERTVKVSL